MELIEGISMLASLLEHAPILLYYLVVKKDIVTELIAKELNQIFQAVKINRIKYKDIKPDRIRRCAIILKEELRLQVKIPEIPIPIDRNTLKIQHDKIDTAICDITEKLGLKPGKVLSKFEYKLKELGISLVANKGHKRAPNVVAGLIFKVHRNKVTIRNLNKNMCCGNKSLQKILRLLAVSIYKETA